MNRLKISLLFCLYLGTAHAQVLPQNPNLFWASPSTGTGYLELRQIAPQDFNSGTGASGTTCLSGLMTWIACNLTSSVINTGAQGQLAYYAVAGTTVSPLSAGTSGQFLQSNGASAAPSWAGLPATSAFTFGLSASPLGGLY